MPRPFLPGLALVVVFGTSAAAQGFTVTGAIVVWTANSDILTWAAYRESP